MHTFKKKATFFIVAAAFAYAYFGFTAYVYFSLTDRNPLYSTIINAVVIIFFVIMEKIEDTVYIRLKQERAAAKLSLPKRILMWYVSDNVSAKSSLYLFYIVVLICTALVTADPDFPVLYTYTGYFQSVYYGLLILVAFDKFMQQLFKDMAKRE